MFAHSHNIVTKEGINAAGEPQFFISIHEFVHNERGVCTNDQTATGLELNTYLKQTENIIQMKKTASEGKLWPNMPV